MNFIHHLPQASLLLRADTTILQANQIASDLFKYDISDLMGKQLTSLLSPDNRANFLDKLEKLSSEQVLTWKTDFSCGDNFTRKITINFARLPGETIIAQMQEDKPEPPEKDDRYRKIKLLEAQCQQACAAIILINENEEVVYSNKEFGKMWDITSNNSAPLDLDQTFVPVLEQLKEPDNFLEKIKYFCKSSNKTTNDELELKDGRIVQEHSYPIYKKEHYLGRLWHFIDITEFKRANKIINRQQNFLQAVLENIQDGIIACDKDYRLTFFNQEGRELHGLDKDTFTSKKWTEKYKLYKEDGITPVPTDKQPLFRVLQGEKICNEEMVIKAAQSFKHHHLRVSGQAIYDNGNSVSGAVVTLHDITDLKNAQHKLQHMAYHDSLTGLPNRRLFHLLLTQTVYQARREQHKVAVCFFDLDNFKLVNDKLGHSEGDRMLIKVTRIVRSCLRVSDMICRWGGDEFVVALPQINHRKDATHIAEKIRRNIEQEILQIYPEFSVTTSMGIALYPDHASHPDNLIRMADIAMYLAKQKGKNRFYFSDPELTPEGFDNSNIIWE
ncbi:MAG: diguanylate cyclase [Desulfurivibrionaceae bacterium]